MQKESGNILFYILLGIVLTGAITVVLNRAETGTRNIDKESMILKATQIMRYGDELRSAVGAVLDNGLSEADIRFAHPDAATEYGTITTNPTHQVFGKSGGKATYRTPPAGVNDGSKWEFFATTEIPQVGSDRAELTAVLPNVTQGFCAAVNAQLGFTVGTQPTDNATGSTPDCVMGASAQRFTGSFSDTSPNVMDATTYSHLPAMSACVYCASNSTYNFYTVLLTR